MTISMKTKTQLGVVQCSVPHASPNPPLLPILCKPTNSKYIQKKGSGERAQAGSWRGKTYCCVFMGE